MKRIPQVSLLLLLAAAFVLGSPKEYYGVNYAVIADSLGNPGGGIKLTWSEPQYDACVGFFSCCPEGSELEGYIVSVDGVDLPLTKDSVYFLYTPGASIEVSAVYDGEKYPSAPVDLSAVETPTLEVWSMDDPSPEYPSGFGFHPTGTATAYSVSAGIDNEKIDFFIASGLKIASPTERVPAINNERNTTSIETGTYDGLKIVSPCKSDLYSTVRDLQNNGIYSLWIDPTNNGYSTDDNFAKAHVIGIDGYKVTLKLSCQAVSGLRWIVN